MIALLWLFSCWAAGWRWFGRWIGEPADFLVEIGGSRLRTLTQASPWASLLFRLAASLWLGLLPIVWLTYAIAALLAPVLPLSVHPLLPANLLVLLPLAVWLTATPLCRRIRELNLVYEPDRPLRTGWATLVRSIRRRDSRFYLYTVLIWLTLGIFLMCSTFYRDGTLYKAGYSVFSDFAPHTALVSSFAEGRNWPTEYPHFANDGIAYHFMFFFLCGNLQYLGLPLDWAINLPSILGLISFCLLLGILAIVLTGRRSSFLLAPLLLFLRSSCAFWTFLGDLIREFGAAPAAWPSIIRAVFQQETYIGHTVHDDWGLWGVNVYANQRHLLPGLSVALIILLLFLPFLGKGIRQKKSFRQWLLGREYWLDTDPTERRRLVPALLLAVLLPYFHGSALVSVLLILCFIGFFASNRPAFLALGLASVLSALLQSRLFAGDAARVVQPSFLWGFISPDRSAAGVALYLLEMSGILLPLLFLAFWLPGRRRKILLAAFLLPLLFALTVSLTPDVTVNHKFIMITFAFGNIYIADLLARLWPARRLAAVILAAVLMITGVQEMIILRNISRQTVAIDAASPLVTWIVQNTRPDAVFVSAPYHYNAFYLSGRSTWLGHAYYAWSAGHDTAGRLELEQWLLSGGDGSSSTENLAAIADLIASAGLDYLLLDDTLRNHPEFQVNEDFFDAHFPGAAEFPTLGRLKVYDLRRMTG